MRSASQEHYKNDDDREIGAVEATDTIKLYEPQHGQKKADQLYAPERKHMFACRFRMKQKMLAQADARECMTLKGTQIDEESSLGNGAKIARGRSVFFMIKGDRLDE